MEFGTVSGSPNDLIRLPAASNIRIGGACCEVSFSSSVMLRDDDHYVIVRVHAHASQLAHDPARRSGFGQEDRLQLGRVLRVAASANPSSIR